MPEVRLLRLIAGAAALARVRQDSTERSSWLSFSHFRGLASSRRLGALGPGSATAAESLSARSLKLEVLLLLAWAMLRPDPNCASMPETNSGELAQRPAF